MIRNVGLFVCAAVLEITGCFTFWLWLKRGSTAWLGALGVASLAGFAVLLAKIDAPFAGRAYAAYGGIYIAVSLGWLWAVEGQRPNRIDLLGAGLSLLGAILIVTFASRGR